jgi:hypothetical protein
LGAWKFFVAGGLLIEEATRKKALAIERMMPDIERDEISEGQIEEAEQDAADPSHDENPTEREEEESGNTDVNE